MAQAGKKRSARGRVRSSRSKERWTPPKACLAEIPGSSIQKWRLIATMLESIGADGFMICVRMLKDADRAIALAHLIGLPIPDVDNWTSAEATGLWAEIGRAVWEFLPEPSARQRGAPRGPRFSKTDHDVLEAAKKSAATTGKPFNSELRRAIANAMKRGALTSSSSSGSDLAATHFKRIHRLKKSDEEWLEQQHRVFSKYGALSFPLKVRLVP